MKTSSVVPGSNRAPALHAGLLLLAGLLGLVQASPALAMRPSREYAATPSDYGILYRDVTFTTGDSLTLHGWFYPAQDTAGIANDLVGQVMPVPPERRPAPRTYQGPAGGPAPTIVICDGDGGNMADLIFYAYQFATRGFNVFTFDWRGFGSSAEWPLDPNRLSAAEFLRDYDAALDFVMAQPEVKRGGVGLLGFSTGAYLSFAEAAKRRDVAAFAGRALLTSFDDILPILKKLDPGRPWSAPPDYPKHLLPAAASGRMRVPAYLVVGEKDARTPPWMSRKVYARLKGPKELWVVPGAGHGGPEAPELANYPEFFDRLARFYRKHLG